MTYARKSVKVAVLTYEVCLTAQAPGFDTECKKVLFLNIEGLEGKGTP